MLKGKVTVSSILGQPSLIHKGTLRVVREHRSRRVMYLVCVTLNLLLWSFCGVQHYVNLALMYSACVLFIKIL